MSTTVQIIPERLDALTAGEVTLDRGAHFTFDEGHCAMEVVAWLAGLGNTDAPECVSPVLQKFTIDLNDSWDDEQRQKLVRFLPRMVDTNGDGQDEARSYLALDWLIRTYTPAWLDLAGLVGDAQALRGLPRIVDMGTAGQAGPVVRAGHEHSRAARASAWAAAGDAAGDAAWEAAAGDAAWEAAGASAWAAAGDAAWDAAMDAAMDAARSAIVAAAGDAEAALQPTVTMLQTSALDLLDRMIHPSVVTG